MKKGLIVIAVLIGFWGLLSVMPSIQTPSGVIQGQGISITINKVTTDLNTVSFEGTVKGKEKVVAVEVKQDLPKETEGEGAARSGTDLKWGMHGLWVGGAWRHPLGQPFTFSLSHELNLTKPQYFLVFYTSAGEVLNYPVKISSKLRDAVREVVVDRVVDLDGQELKITKIKFGLTQTAIELETEKRYMWQEIEFVLTDLNTGKTYKSKGYSFSGGKGYHGGYAFEKAVPLPAGAVEVTIRNTATKVEKTLVVR